MKILIFEDEQKIAANLKKGLEENLYNVDVAYDGLYGKKLALEKKYDLIILDIIIPNINGVDLCKEIRNNNISTPILMLTALGTTDDKVLGLELGGDDYMTKPFSIKELRSRIKAVLRRSGEIPEDKKTAVLKYKGG